jgi:hypothetical protein
VAFWRITFQFVSTAYPPEGLKPPTRPSGVRIQKTTTEDCATVTTSDLSTLDTRDVHVSSTVIIAYITRT